MVVPDRPLALVSLLDHLEVSFLLGGQRGTEDEPCGSSTFSSLSFAVLFLVTDKFVEFLRVLESTCHQNMLAGRISRQ